MPKSSSTAIYEESKLQEEEDIEFIGITLRKSAAFTLERFSKIYHGDVFYILHEPLENALKSHQIDLMEPAILILGAISELDGAFNLI
jgi:hypothetical protein